ncbi:MAG TPA: DUF58 domain-containing protein [Candidatus Melainabacteria bacterium]|nr:DUF58 domain-containing protein [Candidatus Melainabacteria bacterium]
MRPQSRLRSDEAVTILSKDSGKRAKRAWALPVGLGYRIYLEARFVSMLAIGLCISLTGALCNNEWLYLLSSAFVSAAMLGAIIPFLILAFVSFDYALPEEVLASDQAAVIVKLKKSKILGPLSGLVPVKWLRLNIDAVRRGKDGTSFEAIYPPEPVLIDSLDGESWYEFPTPNLQRGVYKFNGVELSTCFPLGITWWSRKFAIKDKKNVLITVYPRHYAVSGNFMTELRGVSSTMGLSSALSAVTHQSTSFRSVREFRTGDSLRHIHWALTAKAGEILVKEFDQETLPVFNLLLNLRANWRNREQFELAVSTMFSLCHLGYSMGQVPNLFLNPPMNSNQLKPLLFDIPSGLNPGLDLYAEVLARVEPVSVRSESKRVGVDKEIAEVDLELDESLIEIDYFERDLLTLLPSGDSVIKYNPDQGDVVCYPIDLAIVPEGWDYEEPAEDKRGVAAMVNFDKLRPKAGGDNNIKQLMGPDCGQVIGKIDWIKDLEAL